MIINAWAALGTKQKLSKFSYDKDMGENDILVQIKYCSLLKADIFFIDNFWNDTKYPLVPSSEMFGIITRIGSKVENLMIGDYVGVSYQVYACLKCDYCNNGTEQFCKQQRLLGIHEYGGLAEHIIVNSNFAYKIPQKLQKPEYVSLMGYGLTAYSAIKHANLDQNMHVGVIGVGNLGHLAVQIIAKHGLPVTAFSHTANKVDQLKKLGVTNFINPLDDKQLKVNEKQYDFLLVTTYHSYDWSKFIKLLKPEGAICFVGLPSENITFPAVLLADYARRKITGSYIGSRQDMTELLEFAEKTDIKAITQVYEVNEVDKVISMLRENTIPYNAAVKIS
jgi:D-arabinose 1-dehydrogenase-like Zn-dependent alcohol dehydrogenase